MKENRKSQQMVFVPILSPWNQPLTLSIQALPPLIVIYHVSSLIHSISKSSTDFVPILSPFSNELIKHIPREEWDAMYEIQN
jgi:hypothetical protein